MVVALAGWLGKEGSGPCCAGCWAWFKRERGQVGDIVTQDGGHRTKWSRSRFALSQSHLC